MQVKKIFNEIYGELDKRSLKVKKALALALMKNNQNEDAFRELLETEVLVDKFNCLLTAVNQQLQAKCYGNDSPQLAKTLRIIGALHLLENNFLDAQRYFNRALKIFEENGMKQAVLDVKKKIRVAREMREKNLAKLPERNAN